MRKLLKSVGYFFVFLWKNIDAIISIIIAGYAAYVGVFGVTKIEYLVSAIASVLVFLSLGIIVDRRSRNQLNSKILLLDKLKTADDFFLKEIDDRELIDKAKNEIVLLQESSRKLFDHDHTRYFCKLLEDGKNIRCIVVLGQDSNIVKLMSMRNDNLDFNKMQEQLQIGVKQIEYIQKEADKHAMNFEVRFFPYPTDITGVFIDANSQTKEAIIRLQGFKIPFNEKLTFRINNNDDRYTTQLYFSQMENIWKYSTKCIFLTGVPGVGKSTLLKKIVDRIKEDKKHQIKIEGFITNSIIKQNKRTGFETNTIDNSLRKTLATKNKEIYTLNGDAMDNLIIPSLKKGIESKETELLVIDEIGPIQTQSEEFKLQVKRALNNHCISILGIIAVNDETYINDIKYHYRTRVVDVNTKNRDKLVETIVREFI